MIIPRKECSSRRDFVLHYFLILDLFNYIMTKEKVNIETKKEIIEYLCSFISKNMTHCTLDELKSGDFIETIRRNTDERFIYCIPEQH